MRTWPLDVLISRYGDDESQALLAQAKRHSRLRHAYLATSGAMASASIEPSET